MPEAAALVREARETDVPAIRDIFETVYRGDYPHREFFDDAWLKRSVFADDILVLVAEDEDDGRVLGTASVVFDAGVHSDLLGEMGRLAVHPEARSRGIGRLLMRKRVEAIEDRLHVGIVRNRTVHSASQRISEAFGFTPVGFLPLHSLFRRRESSALYARHFGVALQLRRNNPRVVAEAHALAQLALQGCGLPGDAIQDEVAAPHPHVDGFEVETLSAEGLPALLRIERGRVRRRRVFGPARLQYGTFMLEAKSATYLIAREPAAGAGHGPVAGAVGFIHDQSERTVRIFELITRGDEAVRFLLDELTARCLRDWDVDYAEIDVSAHGPRLQRTLLELGFLPAAYVPAMVFHEVERLDVVRFVRLFVPPELGPLDLTPATRAIADRVLPAFKEQAVLPTLAAAMGHLALFDGLTDEQARRLAGACDVQEFREGEPLFTEGDPPDRLFLLVDGTVRVALGSPAREVAEVGAGESLGEMAVLTGEPHSASATAGARVLAACLTREALERLGRRRPDIGIALYRNLAVSLGRKLLRTDERLGGEG